MNMAVCSIVIDVIGLIHASSNHRYLDLLVGRLPEDKATYDARSPIKHVDGFSSPVIFFQVGEQSGWVHEQVHRCVHLGHAPDTLLQAPRGQV
jgi:hypothetical protein